MVQRNQLRQDLRLTRKNLSSEQQLAAADSVASNINSIPEFQHANSIGGYIVNDGEIDPAQLILQAWKNNKAIYLPKIKTNNDMVFVRYEQNSTLEKNQYGIAEPSSSDVAETLDVVLVPLVGFDKSGNRLGMGGGYYDRYLAHCQQHTYLIGLAHHCQQVTQLEIKSWDIPLNLIVTDNQIINC
ncbi:MAG: 5-formyltetrahydrofolate cyclo-ligase [Pseudomonadales bacterium]|jgi:5-formyltetrahydrofolate cyclo-ligase